MVAWFLLHNASDVGIGGVSGEGKFCCWRRMLQRYRGSQESLNFLKRLLGCGGPLQSPRSPLQEIGLRVQHLSTIWQETGVKVYHAEKTLQLLDVLGGGEQFWISVVWSVAGAEPAAEILCPRNSKVETAKTHFSKLMASPLMARAEKSLSKWWRCVSLSGDPTRVSSMYGNVPSRSAQVWSITLWKVWAAFDKPKGVNKYSNKPKGVIWAFYGCLQEQLGSGDTPWQGQFLKIHCNHPNRLKGLACLAEGTCQG